MKFAGSTSPYRKFEQRSILGSEASEENPEQKDQTGDEHADDHDHRQKDDGSNDETLAADGALGVLLEPAAEDDEIAADARLAGERYPAAEVDNVSLNWPVEIGVAGEDQKISFGRAVDVCGTENAGDVVETLAVIDR